jgi:hypothetical protein
MTSRRYLTYGVAVDERDFSREITSAWTLLKERLEIGRFLIAAESLRIDETFQQAALDEDSTYEEIFRVGLSRSNYNIMLSDYAYFQFNWTADDAWRLGYFPNPWLSGAPAAEQTLRQWEALEEIGALSYDDVSELIADMPHIGAVPPIRFEFAARDYQEFVHPAAHFHIGRHTENRWPSALSIGPKAFTLIIAKLYYPESWARCSSFHGGAEASCIENALSAVMRDVRAVHQFSERERQSFHFGKNMVAQARA